MGHLNGSPAWVLVAWLTAWVPSWVWWRSVERSLAVMAICGLFVLATTLGVDMGNVMGLLVLALGSYTTPNGRLTLCGTPCAMTTLRSSRVDGRAMVSLMTCIQCPLSLPPTVTLLT